MPLTPAELRDEVDVLCHVSAPLSGGQLSRALRIGEAASQAARELAFEAVVANKGRPVLMAYMCDGWSCRVSNDRTVQLGDHCIRRRGHFRHEFLLERAVLRFRDAGTNEEQVHMMFGPPRGLRLGKTSLNVLTAACDFVPLLRAIGYEGVSITVYLQDGMLFSASLRLFRARHALWHDFQEAEGPHDPMERDRDLVIGIKCVAHAIHNSLTWGLGPYCNDELVDDSFLVISALLNGSSAIHTEVHGALLRVVKFVKKTDRPEDVRAFWRLLEVSLDVIDLFIELDPWWTGVNLEINVDCEADPSIFQKISQVAMYGYRWLRWSKSRWCRSGRASRFFVRSLALGVDAVMQEVRMDTNYSNYLLGSWTRCRMEIKRMLCILSQAAKPAESLLLAVLKDDRFLRYADEYHRLLLDTLEQVTQIGDVSWARFGDVVGVSAQDIKHCTVYTATAAVAYIEREVFTTIKGGILGLTQGNIQDNVAALAGEPPGEIKDIELDQIRRLLAAGEPAEHIVDAIKLLRESPCTTSLVEEGHGSASVLRKYHDDYSAAALCSRALLHQQRAIFVALMLQSESVVWRIALNGCIANSHRK